MFRSIFLAAAVASVGYYTVSQTNNNDNSLSPAKHVEAKDYE